MEQYRDCLVCGKKFKVCTTCRTDIPEVMQWRRVVCCAQHFVYHLPIIRYARNIIDKKTAKEELQQAIDGYGEIEFSDNVKAIVAEILADEPTDEAVDEPTEKLVETITDNENTVVEKTAKTKTAVKSKSK